MSRGQGKTQWAVYECLHGIGGESSHAGPQEIARLAVGVWIQKRYEEPPEPLPRSWLVTVRRAVAAMESKGNAVTGYAPRQAGTMNPAHARMGLDLVRWAWTPDMEPPAGWCCLLTDKPRPREKTPPAPRNLSVASGCGPLGIQSDEEAHALFADMVDGIYRVEPMASELRAMTDINAIVDRICSLFKISEPHRPYVMIQALRRVDNVVDKTMDTMDNVS